MRPPRARAGHTLIEMLVVIVLMGLLVAIVFGSMEKMNTGQQRTECISRLKALSRAIEIYREDWGDVPNWDPTAAPGNNGLGLYALVMLDYLRDYRFLKDPASPVELPWTYDSGGAAGGVRIEVVPGDNESMIAAYNEFYTPVIAPGTELTSHQEWLVYDLLARPACHNFTGSWPSDFGSYEQYDAETYENYCSWMMRDAYSQEWKYRPVRRTVAPPAGEPAVVAGGFPVDDPTSEVYHRQLSHRWTDEDSPFYLPASDTVVTWSNLFRQVNTQEVDRGSGLEPWGQDLVLYADGHVALLAGPASSDPTEGRAVQRPTAP